MPTARSVSAYLPAWLAGKRFFSVLASIYICAATAMTWHILGRPLIGADDANIFFVYARNFIHGHGIVYSVGGEHVEGFSSPLYFLLCVLAYACSGSPETVLFALDLLFAILASLCIISVIADIADHLQISSGVKFLFLAGYLVWLLFNPCYFAWIAVSLMDTAIYSLLLTAGFAFLARTILANPQASPRVNWQLCALIILLVLSRPEGILWAALLCAAFAYIRWNTDRTPLGNLRNLSAPLASLLLTPAALALFRIAYFGYPLPNTYYAKVSSSLSDTLHDGWNYLAGFLSFQGFYFFLPLLLLVVWIACALLSKQPRTKLFTLVCLTAAFSLAGLFIPVLEGGDHFYAFRMFQPVYPLLFLSLIFPPLLFPVIAKKYAQSGYAAALILLITLTSYTAWNTFEASNQLSGPVADMRTRIRIEFFIAASERENGARLRQLFQEDLPTIGFGSAGGIAYGYNGTVYDMMGLNDTRMAHADAVKTGPKGHQSFNKDVFYQLAPDMLMPRAALAGTPVDINAVAAYFTDPGSWDNQIFKGLFNDARFRATYTFALLFNASHPENICYGYFSNAYLARLSQDKQIQIHYLPG